MCVFNKEALFQNFKMCTFPSETFMVNSRLNVFFLFKKKRELFYSEFYEEVKKVNQLIPVFLNHFYSSKICLCAIYLERAINLQ